MIGITSAGAYIPRRRLARKAAAQAMGWLQPGLYGQAKGHRAMANWDEDALTMAVEAARTVLRGGDAVPQALYFASTTAPFAERLNASVIAAALGLPATLETADIGGSRRCGLTALLQALRAVEAKAVSTVLVTAGELRPADAASPVTLRQGDAAAALAIGEENILARFVVSHSETEDFVDSYRAADQAHEQYWEDRWIREQGYQPLAKRALHAMFTRHRIDPGESGEHIIA